MSVLEAAALMATLATSLTPPSPTVYDVAVYGATPGGIMAAIAARRANVSTTLGQSVVPQFRVFVFSTCRLRLVVYYSIKIS